MSMKRLWAHYKNNKQLLDEVEHDIMNYQNRGLCYLPKPKGRRTMRSRTGACYHLGFSRVLVLFPPNWGTGGVAQKTPRFYETRWRQLGRLRYDINP